ncbi:MAG: hypothetical protein IJ466_06845 [Clostridia bacterium]|nr:hypothetical protein [Clostridia bacterium]
MKKLAILTVAIALLVCVTVYATVAFFTDTEEVTNTFTVGKVQIKLDEEDLSKGDGSRTEDGNEYHLVPAEIYTKDPTVTVEKGSEPAYVRMIVTVNHYSKLNGMISGGFHPAVLVEGYNDAKWPLYNASVDTATDTITYEFRYHQVVDAKAADVKLDPLFTHFTVPEELTAFQLLELMGDSTTKEDDFAIKIVGHAIQTTGFGNDEEAAWNAFNNQNDVVLPTVAPSAAPSYEPSESPTT